MEYGLRAEPIGSPMGGQTGLNPCFNGIWSASGLNENATVKSIGLIRILMCWEGE